MDKKEKYEIFLKRIEQISSENSKSVHLSKLQEMSEYIGIYARDDMPPKTYNLVIYLSSIFICIICVIYFIKTDYWIGLLPIVGLLLFHAYTRWQLLTFQKELSTTTKEEGNIVSHAEYMLKGIATTQQRLKNIRLLFLIFFPILLYFILQFFNQDVLFNNQVINVIVIFIFSGVIWYFVFDKDIAIYDYYTEQIEDQIEIIDSMI